MTKNNFFLILSFIFCCYFFFSCKSKNAPLVFYTLLENTRLRDAPGTTGKELCQLPYNTPLVDMNEVSDFSTPIKLQGVPYNEPWLKVRTPNGQVGWVYAGAVRFDADSENEKTKLLIDKRLQSFFGKKIALQLSKYQEKYNSTKTAADLAAAYTEANYLRDTIATMVASKVMIDNQRNLPDLFWLRQSLLGYVPQLAAEGTTYWLFADYKLWQQKAQQTEGNQDDIFMNVCLSAYASDSIECFFPVWKIQTTDYEASSELGKGIHKKMLDEIEVALQTSPLFKSQLMFFKEKIFTDITDKNNTYWQSKELIIKELDAILAKNYASFTASEKIALRTRRQQFDDPDANGILVNLRSGETSSTSIKGE